MTKSKTAKYGRKKSVSHSIRFSEGEYLTLKAIAEDKNIQFSSLVRDSCMAHIKNMNDHEELMTNLEPENPQNVQKSFFDALNNNNEVVLKTLHNYIDQTRKKQELLDELIRKVMYLLMYFNREVPDNEKAVRVTMAKKRLEAFLKSFDEKK